MMMAMKPHQMLILLLMLLFVANLPACSSQMHSARYIRSLREARREALSGQSQPVGQRGGWREMNINGWFPKLLVDRAARRANVTSADALQCFCKVR